MHALHEFDDDGSGASERKYRSEPVPPEGTKVAGLYQVVAGSFFDVMVGCCKFKLSVGSGIEYMVSNRSTNQNCPFRRSDRPTRQQSDRVAILDLIDPRFRGDHRD